MRLTKALIARLAADPGSELRQMAPDQMAHVIRKANEAYHARGEPLFDDAVFDAVVDALRARDASHPALAAVGHAPTAAAAGGRAPSKGVLPFYMGSLNKIKGDDARGLADFVRRHPGHYVISDKLDGVSALFVEWDGGARRLFSRGDGSVGQDITHLMHMGVAGFPPAAAADVTPSGAAPGRLAVRGELIVRKDDFHALLHDERARARPPKNARNMVAGLVNAKTPRPELVRHVRFVAYALIEPPMAPSDQLRALRRMGFEVVAHDAGGAGAEALTPGALSDALVARRAASPYEMDGIVVAHDQHHGIDPGRNPDAAFAFKSDLTQQQSASVEVTSVEWNVSKDGYLIPTVRFQPVRLSGVTVQKATGFNAQFVRDARIGPGALLTVVRSGDVIPHIVQALAPAAAGRAQMPPDGTFEWTESGKHIRVARQGGAALAMRQMEHFFKTLGVPGLRGGTVARLYAAGFTGAGRVWRATAPQLMAASGFQRRSAEAVVDHLRDAARRVTVAGLMEASNAFGRGLGNKKLRAILDSLGGAFTCSADALLYNPVPGAQALTALHGVSDKTAAAFVEGLTRFRAFLASERLVDVLRDAARNDQRQQPRCRVDAGPELPLAGQAFVFTGFRDADLASRIRELGGSVDDNLTRKTAVLVAADEDGGGSSKLTKARSMGTVRITTRAALTAELAHTLP